FLVVVRAHVGESKAPEQIGEQRAVVTGVAKVLVQKPWTIESFGVGLGIGPPTDGIPRHAGPATLVQVRELESEALSTTRRRCQALTGVERRGGGLLGSSGIHGRSRWQVDARSVATEAPSQR